MSSSIISAEARKFLETTSVRGIPRIVKSKSKALFVIWLSGVLTCAGILFWQLTVIFVKYRNYPVSTLLKLAPDTQLPTFPDITVCNICPLVHEKEMSLNYDDYVNTIRRVLPYEAVNEFLERMDKQPVSRRTYDNAFLKLLLPSAYFSNFPMNNSFTSTKNNTPTLACEYFEWDFNPNNNSGNCITNIAPIWNPDYYKCYKFKLAESERNNVRGFSAIFYADEFFNNQMTAFDLNLESSRATGMRVMVHAPGTEPDMKLGINVSPGMETTITLRQTLTTHLPEPYSNCTGQKAIGPLDVVTAYTQDYCLDVCLQKQYMAFCGCLWSIYQFTELQYVEINYTLCGNLTINEEDSNVSWTGLYQLVCAYNYDEDVFPCYEECRAPCTVYEYTKSVSAASWPHISTQASFYSTYILGNDRFGTTYDDYQVFFENVSLSASDLKDLLQKLDSEGLIANNFLQLNVVFDSETFDIRADVAAIPVESLGAQIGGVLSLWLGVTIMFIFEVFEFIFTLIMACYKSRQKFSTTKIQCASMK